MPNQLTIGTWNLCLGLPNKKDIVVDILSTNNISICCLQETEIPTGFPENILNVGGFKIELEMNNEKRRAGIYINTEVNYVRRTDLEKENMHIVVIDVKSDIEFRIINIYRSFRPPGGISADTFFVKQLSLIKIALCANCYVVGDFNLDAGKANRPDYASKLTLEKLDLFATSEKLTQIVDFNTWSRVINGNLKTSLLDHIYVKNPATINDIFHFTPPFGDHLLVIANLKFRPDKKESNSALKREWKKYDGSGLLSTLTPLITSLMSSDLSAYTVQDIHQ